MEIYKSGKLKVNLENGVLNITKKVGGCMGITKEEPACALVDIVDIAVYKNGSCAAVATKTAHFNLEMNKTAVEKLTNEWKSVRTSEITEKIFEKKGVVCYLTSDNILVFHKTQKDHCYSSPYITAVCLPVADVVFKDIHKKNLKSDTFILGTETEIIEIERLEANAIERLDKIVDLKEDAMQTYNRKGKLTLFPEIERIYATPRGIGYYFKKGGDQATFRFNPWDHIMCADATSGWFSKKLIVVSKFPIVTINKFKNGDVEEIINHINEHVKNNAGKGRMFGKGDNKVYVTDTHVLCVGNKDFQSIKKPYKDGRRVDKGWFSSTVSINGFMVKVGRNDWKGGCCSKGQFYLALREEPTHELKEEATSHKM